MSGLEQEFVGKVSAMNLDATTPENEAEVQKLGFKRHGLVVHPLALDRSSAGLGDAWRTMVQLWNVFRAVRPDVV